MFEIITQHEFTASLETAWKVLIDFSSYAEWNPFIIKANLQEKTLSITTYVANDKPRHFKPNIISFIPNKALSWKGKVGFEFLLNAEHGFYLEEIGHGRIRLTHKEQFGGILAGLISQDQRDRIKNAFEKMNSAFAKRVTQNL